MSRAAINYAERREFTVANGVDVTTPVAGHYRFRLRSGAVRGGVRLHYGPPLDPVTGEVLDRSWRWMAEFNGEFIDFERVWPACAGAPITAHEYRQYVDRSAWAKTHAPDSAYADPRRAIDPLSLSNPMVF